MRLHLIALSLLLATQFCTAGELFRIVGPDGKVRYSDRPPDKAESVKAIKVPGIASKSSADYTIDQAVGRVIGMETTVQSLTRFCGKQVPKSSPAVREARDAWLVRNSNLSQQGHKVARDLMTMSELQRLDVAFEIEGDRVARFASAATPEMKAIWCAEAPANFAAREMDPSRDLALVRVLMGYKFTKQ
jgi:hypothetical protein